jgi:hypothetical protein
LADPKRNATEVLWLSRVAQLDPEAAPRVLANDPLLGVFAMEYLPPSDYEPWKARLARGDVRTETAAAVGRQLASIHSAFARASSSASDFDTGNEFRSLRLEPYLIATARVHRDLAPILESLAARTASTNRTVVHGDVSPKNIMVGPRGPVFLDAECAWAIRPSISRSVSTIYCSRPSGSQRRPRGYLSPSTRSPTRTCVASIGSRRGMWTAARRDCCRR